MKPEENKLRKELGLETPGAGHKNYSVKAGAGGGKTTLLSWRITNQIIQGTPIEEFVIITYTNAAAAELREKITGRLQGVLKAGTLSKEESAYAKQALDSIELIQISTIHAFLFKILREYAFESGIAIDAKMLEDSEDVARRKEFFDKWYHENFDEIEAFRDDWKHVADSGNISEHHREVFENMFNDIANVREEIIFDTKDHTADFDKAAEEYLNDWFPKALRFVLEIEDNAPVKEKTGEKILLTSANSVISAIKTVENHFNGGIKGIDEARNLAEAFKAARSAIRTKNKYFYGKKYPDEEESVAQALPINDQPELEWNFEKLYKDYFLKSRKAARAAEYVCRIQKAYQRKIDEETLVLSNDDILFRAKNLLSNHSDILEKLRDRYTKIYVDEFQDTTGLQTDIIELISEKKGADLSVIDLKEDKLLVVGDSKQSIYRFTGAEKAVYDDVDRLMDTLPDELAESVNLESNFRSNSKIVDWINKSFNGSANGTSQGLMKDYSEMSTDWVVSENAALHGVFRYGEPGITTSKEEDVANVVNLVQKLVNDPRYFVERVSRSGDGGASTPVLNEIRYSDIMIICRNTTGMDRYVEAFSAAGIPVNVQGKFKISEDEVLRNFVLIAEYFAEYKNKKTRVSAAQILRGIDVSKVDESALSDAENELRSLRRQFRENNLDPAAILQRLMTHEEYFIPKGKKHEVERVRSYRIRLHQMVEACLGKNSGDLAELVSIMKEYLTTDVKREIPLESNENAIRLMNAHQSKGLTGQVVIIADRSANEECRYSGFRKGGKYYPAAIYRFNSMGASSAVTVPTYGYDRKMLRQVYKDETEEAIRLQYVAASRAAHALIIMPRATAKNVPWFSDGAYDLDAKADILKWLDDRDNDTKTYTVESAGKSASHPVVKLCELASNIASTDIAGLSEKQLTSITPSGLEPEGVTGFGPADAGYVKEDRPGGNIFGTVMHRVYELIFDRYDTIGALPEAGREIAIGLIVNRALLEQADELRAGDQKDYSAFLTSVMKSYLTKVIAPIIAEADEIYPEYTFSFYVSESERKQFVGDFDRYFKAAREEIRIGDEDIWVNGQADLVVKRKDGTVKVYDYKSDAMNGKAFEDFEKSLAGKYEGQLALYRFAIGKAFGVKEVETELIHLYR